jgi:hypothetical protein
LARRQSLKKGLRKPFPIPKEIQIFPFLHLLDKLRQDEKGQGNISGGGLKLRFSPKLGGLLRKRT